MSGIYKGALDNKSNVASGGGGGTALTTPVVTFGTPQVINQITVNSSSPSSAIHYLFYRSLTDTPPVFGTDTPIYAGGNTSVVDTTIDTTTSHLYRYSVIVQGYEFLHSTPGVNSIQSIINPNKVIKIGSIGVGNSIMAGYLSTKSFFFQLAEMASLTDNQVFNLAVSNTGAKRAAHEFLLNTNGCPLNPVGPSYIGFIGFNNIRGTITNPGITTITTAVQCAYRAIAAAHFAKSIHFFTDSGFATFSNGSSFFSSEQQLSDFQMRTLYFRHNVGQPGYNSGANAFLKSVAANENITFQLTTASGEGIVIGLPACAPVHDFSRVQVTIDGTIVATYNPNIYYQESIDTTNGIYVCADALIFANQTVGTHTIILSFLDVGKTACVDYAEVMNKPDPNIVQSLYVIDNVYMGDGVGVGNNYPGGESSDLIMNTLSQAIWDGLNPLLPGYPTVRVAPNTTSFDVGIAYNAKDPTQTNSDQIHPVFKGDTGIANAIRQA